MLNIAIFEVDCTPPLGAPVGLNVNSSAREIRDPLFARGLIFDDGTTRAAVVSLDYCALVHSAYEDLRNAISRAVLAIPENVVIHCIHQHDAPLLDFEAARYVPGFDPSKFDWWPKVISKCAERAEKALDKFIQINQVGYAASPVIDYASNRRVKMPEGSIKTRWSRSSDDYLLNAPEGIIDRMLKTVAFKAPDDKIIASMSFYATHPQVANTGDKFSADAPGEAVRLISEKYGFNAFFTGAGGNITAGKYASYDDPEGNLEQFGKKLANAITSNFDTMNWQTVDALHWSTTSFQFPERFATRDELNQCLAENPGDINAMALLGTKDFDQNPQYVISKLQIGNAEIVFLPGEPFVEYQLFINSMRPESFIAVAANCRDDFFYLPLAESFSEPNGYETNHFCRTDERFETEFKKAVQAFLANKN
jgi:hypothetical protein